MTDTEHADLRELRSDLIEYMQERFDRVEAGIDRLGNTATDHEARLSVMEDRCKTIQADKPKDAAATPFYKNQTAWTSGSVGTAIGMIILKIVEVLSTPAAQVVDKLPK